MNSYWDDNVIVVFRHDPPLILTAPTGAHRVDKHDDRVTVTFPLLQPHENGLRTNEEADENGDVVDRAFEVADAHDALWVGRRIYSGVVDMTFHVANGTVDIVAASLRDMDAGRYQHRVHVESDPSWTLFHTQLKPTENEYQHFYNMSVLQQLEQHGDDPTLARKVDHVAHFDDLHEVGQAFAALVAAGFAVERDSDTGLALEFTRTEQLADDRMNDVTDEILSILGPYAATYDGWGCPVTKKQKGLFSRIKNR
jgi:regulator of RNase E activity RraB